MRVTAKYGIIFVMGKFHMSLRTKKDDERGAMRKAIDRAHEAREQRAVLRNQLICLVIVVLFVIIICIKEGVW